MGNENELGEDRRWGEREDIAMWKLGTGSWSHAVEVVKSLDK